MYSSWYDDDRMVMAMRGMENCQPRAIDLMKNLLRLSFAAIILQCFNNRKFRTFSHRAQIAFHRLAKKISIMRSVKFEAPSIFHAHTINKLTNNCGKNIAK